MQHVIVSFGKDNDVEFKFAADDLKGQSADAARQWLTREFEALEADVAEPTGKLLLADLILSVAKYAGERRFINDRGWAEQFARNAAVLMGRNVVRVDVAHYTVGY